MVSTAGRGLATVTSAGLNALPAYGQNVADVDRHIEELRQRATRTEDPVEASLLEQEATNLEDYRRYIVGGKTMVDTAIGQIMPEASLPLNPMPGGPMTRFLKGLAKTYGENLAGSVWNQGFNNVVYGEPVDPGAALRDGDRGWNSRERAEYLGGERVAERANPRRWLCAKRSSANDQMDG